MKEENNNLSFPQRYWWLLVIVACIISPLVWGYIKKESGASKQMITIDSAKSSDSLTHAPPDSLNH